MDERGNCCFYFQKVGHVGQFHYSDQSWFPIYQDRMVQAQGAVATPVGILPVKNSDGLFILLRF